ncbi:serine/threonine-protein kinase [Nonomuraea thailandensis]
MRIRGIGPESPHGILRSAPARRSTAAGGFELLGRLGEGGQGVVYLAKDHSGHNVAVKWLRPDLSGDQVSVERFLREVQVAQQVAPFCTAAVLGTGVEQDRPFIVSEFIEGPSLQRVVQEEGPRTGSVLHRLAIGTATALAAIHQAGIVHRDFKPANVIIGADGPRVIDFGIARALNATSTISSMVVGTPSYMPPEQVMGHTVGRPPTCSPGPAPWCSPPPGGRRSAATRCPR